MISDDWANQKMGKGSGDRDTDPGSPSKAVCAEESGAAHGRLKIFLGYAAGVGKTFSMLEDARARKHEGRYVVAACVESHGLAETDALLEGLDSVPRIRCEYQGLVVMEPDFDAVLARKPEIALVDDLSHTNAPGSRHEKRWQDVEELLSAGIDVYATVNIQHFESLTDIVSRITGVAESNTVPDSLLDMATEIHLVDISPDELLARMNSGKVHIPEQDEGAGEVFFRRGNLLALRELSLRRTADCVDREMREYMRSRSIPGPWAAAERLLVCASGSPYTERLIRTTRRLADEMKAAWFTVYVETPGGGKQLRENRQRVWNDLRLAESLGAQVATVTAAKVAEAIIDFAARHNVTRIVVGKPAGPRWKEFLLPPLVDRIIRQSGAIDVYVVSLEPEKAAAGTESAVRKKQYPVSGYLEAALLVAGATAAGLLVHPFLAPANLVMLYLLSVVLAAIRLGLRPAVMTAFLSVFAFNYFFIPPRLTLAVADTEYLLTFGALFTVGVVISSLVSKARERAEALKEREAQTASLYHLSRDLAAAVDMPDILEAIAGNIEETLDAELAVFLPEDGRLVVKKTSKGLQIHEDESAVAEWVYHNRRTAGRGTATHASADMHFSPIQTSTSIVGVLGIRYSDAAGYTSPQSRKLVEALAGQAAVAIERVLFVQQAEQGKILQARNNLERALLNSISHDLRTPLVSITGSLSAIREAGEMFDDDAQKELIDAAWEESVRLNRFVGNLLDMTRLEAGAVKLKKESCDVQELLGCVFAISERQLGSRKIDVLVPADLPMAAMDMTLMTQVLVNLLDNALKYSPPDKEIAISAAADESWLTIEVSDRGPGIPESEIGKIFDKFYRIQEPSMAGGTGLGLSICKGFVEAHGGKIRAENRSGGGLTVSVAIPLKNA